MEKCKTIDEMNTAINEAKKDARYKEPIVFGICRNDMSLVNEGTCLQSNYLVINYNENHGSAALFRKTLLTLSETDPSILLHKTENEEVYNVTLKFIDILNGVFTPLLDKCDLNTHSNVYAIKMLNSLCNEVIMQNDNLPLGKGKFVYRVSFIFNNAPVETVEGGYLKLYSLSESKAKLRSLNLDGLFGKLTNCAWTDSGEPLDIEVAKEYIYRNKLLGNPNNIVAIDKFPRMLQHVIPDDNTRILDGGKVRMGAQLAAGTTVMPGASYINFNAGTEGPVMVEGRISSSAVVGSGTDIGGGASILGTLSGGNNKPITIGKDCLLEANSVTGISLGDECIVSACCEILSGTKITITSVEISKILKVNPEFKIVTHANILVFKGKELSGLHGITYRRDSETGKIIALRTTRFNKLNPELH